ncbi:hypothetical protein M0812_25023 [Anaeramoeba flamelloides]|uniref:Uncharacterized protein n=1 Tax=Anaeramoeba flamelloides TaxID=1746091 RepID=A0AAV7YL52_9EUKA|nr:hypothetical protein M0812_25023 [Anaeramoeba flamelloides]
MKKKNSTKKRHRRMFRRLSLKRGQLQSILNDRGKENASHLKTFYLESNNPNKNKGKEKDYIKVQENYFLKVNQIVVNEKMKFLSDESYQYKRNYTANPLKSYLKDSRAISSFFESNLHHTKFSRLFKSYIINFAGAPFFNLAQIYYTIMDQKYCSKLKNEFKSTQEYK